MASMTPRHVEAGTMVALPEHLHVHEKYPRLQYFLN